MTIQRGTRRQWRRWILDSLRALPQGAEIRIPEVSHKDYRVLTRMIREAQDEAFLSTSLRVRWGGHDDQVLYAKNDDSNPGPCPRCGVWDSLRLSRPRHSSRTVFRCDFCGEGSPLTSVEKPDIPPESFEILTRRELKRRRSGSAT